MSNETSNGFTKVLQDIRQGALITELTTAMQECVQAAKDTQKPAELLLKVKFTPNGGAIIVNDDIKTKLPIEKTPGSIFFPTEINTLVRQNPDQRELELKTIETPQAQVTELREVKSAS